MEVRYGVRDELEGRTSQGRGNRVYSDGEIVRDWHRRIKQGERWKRGVKEGIRGETANTKGYLKSHMEAYYHKSILKICIYMKGI